MTIDRRTLIGAGIAGGAALGLAAAAARAAPLATTETLKLWPDGPPGGVPSGLRQENINPLDRAGVPQLHVAHTTMPTLTVQRPARPNGAALLLIPGGGYRYASMSHEGFDIAARFAGDGFTCFSLLYRMPADGWRAGRQAPLQDAQRGLRMIRSLAAGYGYAADRIGVIGFSAGGHLAGWLSTRQSVVTQAVNDAIDREPLAPRATALIYPVVTMTGPFGHSGSRVELLGRDASVEQRRAYSIDTDIQPTTPPTFLAHAIDDQTVPVENSLMMLAGLRAAKIPAEAHLFETGGHGFGLTLPDGTPSPWPVLFEAFAKRHGLV